MSTFYSFCERHNIRAFKVGGLRFFTTKRLCVSFCIRRKSPTARKVAQARAAIRAALKLAPVHRTKEQRT